MSLRAQVSQGLRWQAITLAGKHLLSLVVFTILARLLSPTDFGAVAMVGLFTFFASMIADAGIGVALIQRKTLEPGHIDTAFWFSMGANTLIVAATLLLAEPLSGLFSDPSLAPLLRWSSLSLLLNASCAVHQNLFIKNMDFRTPALRTLLGNTVGGAVGVVMALSGLGVWSLVGQQLFGALAGTIVLWSASTYRPSLHFSLRHFSDLLDVGVSVFANAFVWFFASRLDQIVIGRVAGAQALGFYVVASKVPELLRSALQKPVADVSMPALAKLQHDHPAMCRAIYSGMELNAAVMFAAFGGVACVTPELIPLVFGEQWKGAAFLCTLLAIHALLSALQIFYYPALLASGATGSYFAIGVAHAAGVLLACIVGIPYGPEGVVLALTANSFVFAGPALLLLRRRIGLDAVAYYRPALVPALAAAVMGVVIWALRKYLPIEWSQALRLTILIVGGAVAYVAGIRVFQREILTNLWNIAVRTAGVPDRSR